MVLMVRKGKGSLGSPPPPPVTPLRTDGEATLKEVEGYLSLHFTPKRSREKRRRKRWTVERAELCISRRRKFNGERGIY